VPHWMKYTNIIFRMFKLFFVTVPSPFKSFPRILAKCEMKANSDGMFYFRFNFRFFMVSTGIVFFFAMSFSFVNAHKLRIFFLWYFGFLFSFCCV